MKKIISLVIVMMIAMTALFATDLNYKSLKELEKVRKTTATLINEKTARINNPTYEICCYAKGYPKYSDNLIPYIVNFLVIDVVSAYSELDVFLMPKDPSSIGDLENESYEFSFTPLREGTITFNVYLYDQKTEALYRTEVDFYCSLPSEDNCNVNIYSGSPEFGKVFTGTDVQAKIGTYQDIYGYVIFDDNNNIIEHSDSSWYSRNPIILHSKYNNKPGKFTFISIVYNENYEKFCYVKKDFDIFE